MQNLKSLRKNKKLTQEELAGKIGCALRTVSNWEQGRRSPNSTQRKKLASFFKVKEADLFSEKLKEDVSSIEHPLYKVPIISWVHATTFKTMPENLPVDDYIYTTTKGGKNMFALKVKNDCMEPEFREDDIIIIRSDINADNGNFVIVKDSENESATFKQLKKYGKKIILHPLNPKYEDIELDHNKQYEIIGVVIEKVKKYRT